MFAVGGLRKHAYFPRSMATESPPDSSEGSSASVDPADACLTDSDCLIIGNVLAASSHTLEEVASCVNLTKEDILEIEKDPIRVNRLDHMTLVVSKWKEANEELATLSEFLHALRSLNDNTLGDRLQSARKGTLSINNTIRFSSFTGKIISVKFGNIKWFTSFNVNSGY